MIFRASLPNYVSPSIGEVMRRSFLSSAVRRLAISRASEAPLGAAGSLLTPVYFPSSASAAVIPRPSPVYGLQRFGSSFRTFSASASKAGSDLHDVLRKEYTQEIQEPEESAGNPPGHFKLVDTPGTSELVLEQTKGTETISVCVDVESQASELPAEEQEGAQDGDQEQAEPPSLEFTVEIKRADKPGTLTFHCLTHDEDDCYDITDVFLTDDLKDVPEDKHYNGPRFDELDPQVLDAFHLYLRERGVDKRLVEYLENATWDKEQKEYTRWLKRVGDFVR